MFSRLFLYLIVILVALVHTDTWTMVVKNLRFSIVSPISQFVIYLYEIQIFKHSLTEIIKPMNNELRMMLCLEILHDSQTRRVRPLHFSDGKADSLVQFHAQFSYPISCSSTFAMSKSILLHNQVPAYIGLLLFISRKLL